MSTGTPRVSDPHSPDVVVIGGGFAGLSAATALAARGVRVTVLEARRSAGGRATAFTDPATEERVDNGQHVLFGCYRETFRFLERVGSPSLVRLQPQLDVPIVDRAGRASRLVCPRWPAPLHLAGALLRWDALTWRDCLAAMRVLVDIRLRAVGPTAHAGYGGHGGTDGSDRRTVMEWLQACGQTPPLIELLWEPLAVAALNQPIDVAAAAPFRMVLRQMFTTRREDSAIGLPLVPLDQVFVGPSRAFLERHGGTLQTSMPARITARAPSPAGMDGGAGGIPRTRLAVHVREQAWHPRAVICAVAWHALPDVLPPLPALAATVDAAARTEASPIVSVHLWLDRPIGEHEFVGLPGRHMQWMFDKARIFGEGSSHVSLVSSGAAAIAARGNQDLIDLALGELRDAVPAARDAIVLRALAVREKRATFSIAPDAPPRPQTRTAVEHLYLAGDWIATGLPATIESAVLSGHLAAAAVLEDFP